jgi:hypothetical protein
LSTDNEFARRVQEETDSYIREVLAQTQKLRALAASLEAENEQLSAELSRVQAELERQQAEGRLLRQQLAEIARANQESLDRYQAVSAQSASLAHLYVATYRLHGTVDRSEVLSGIQEIIGNLIGCEEMLIFEIDSAGALLPVWSFGIDAKDFPAVRLGEGTIGRVAESREMFLAAQPAAQPGDLSACLPLCIEEKLIGAIALFRLLPQKCEGLTSLDHELLNLLQTHGATALYCTQLHQAGKPAEKASA